MDLPHLVRPSSKHVHPLIEHTGGVEVSVLGRFAFCSQLGPGFGGKVKGVGLLAKAVVVLLKAAEDKHLVVEKNGSMAISRWRLQTGDRDNGPGVAG